jgi:hypothetical protein
MRDEQMVDGGWTLVARRQRVEVTAEDRAAQQQLGLSGGI